MHLACELGHREVLEFLVEISNNINNCNRDNITPLHRACKLGYIDIVSFLIKNNAKINTRDQKGFSPIIDSLLYVGNTELFKLLLENFNEIEEDKIKELVLIAIFKENISVLKLLLDKKINFDNGTYLKGSSPLFQNTVLPIYYDSDVLTAACHKGNIEILNLLWDKIKFNDHQKLYNLELAIRRQNLKVIKFFIEKGLNVFEIVVNSKNDFNNDTAL